MGGDSFYCCNKMAAPPRRGAKLAMPVLIVNLGVEMLYVLEQRLRAQAIPVEKSRQGEQAQRANRLASACPSPHTPYPLSPSLSFPLQCSRT